MTNKSFNYIFIDESGDPGKPFKINSDGEKILTGASLYYILSAVCMDSKQLFLAENKIIQAKNKYKYRSELKSDYIPLVLYEALLDIVNKLDIQTYYRLIDKKIYRGTFAVNDKKKLHNVFDEYNLAKTVSFAIKQHEFKKVEVVIDRADRRLLDGKFDNFDNYLRSKVNTETIKKIMNITHVNSEYVNAMQLSDLISGAIKDYFTGKNKKLIKIIDRKLLKKVL